MGDYLEFQIICAEITNLHSRMEYELQMAALLQYNESVIKTACDLASRTSRISRAMVYKNRNNHQNWKDALNQSYVHTNEYCIALDALKNAVIASNTATEKASATRRKFHHLYWLHMPKLQSPIT
jgi:uncharacterized protein YukE